MNTTQYHLAELAIARDPSRPEHVAPPSLPPGHRVLDVGCGAGQTLITTYPDRLSVGLDIDFQALQLGRTLTDRILFTCGRAEALPYRAASFDAVIARGTLPYTNIPASLREIHRVLRTGGLFWMTLHPWSLCLKQARQGGLKRWGYFAYVVLNSALFAVFQWVAPWPGSGYESFQTAGGISRALRKIGFKEVSITRTRHFVVMAMRP